MLTFAVKNLIIRAKNGDGLARDKLLKKHYNFIAKVSSVICGRFLTWENDEELSIALIAFNEAIDAYDTESSVKFTSFAHTVIKRRLIDYFRGQKKYQNEVLASPTNDIDELDAGINCQSMAEYADNTTQENLVLLIERFKNQLATYNIDINQLPQAAPKHRDTRASLMKAAQALVADQEMVKYLQQYGQLPIKKLCQQTGLSRKVIERGRKYIISLFIILTEPTLSPLKHFTNFPSDN
ncbi:RNA polymerase sigma-I factor [Peptococcaceae bacterium 1198_IL3148]